ncbi:nitroreductase family protein [Nocardia sp. NPDC051030]|uniref:nitroreductase family protein n=1 Tax=Nocardia sp. NPDC051030 TaxID=3155162 RepID=UPI00341AFE65
MYETMSRLRAVRRLKPDPVPDKVIQRVLQAAAWAPSGGNVQPWRVVVATAPEVKQALADIYRPEWERYSAGYAAHAPQDAQARAAFQRNLDAGNYLAAHLQDAPAILVFCFDPRRMAITDMALDRVSVVGGGSVYPAIQNLMLACVAEGLGCTLTTLHCLREDAVKEVLGVPPEWGTAAMIPIGYPVGRGHGPITRRPPGELAFRDRFGTRWAPEPQGAAGNDGTAT